MSVDSMFGVGILGLLVCWLWGFAAAIKRWGKKGWWLLGTAPILVILYWFGFVFFNVAFSLLHKPRANMDKCELEWAMMTTNQRMREGVRQEYLARCSETEYGALCNDGDFVDSDLGSLCAYHRGVH